MPGTWQVLILILGRNDEYYPHPTDLSALLGCSVKSNTGESGA